MGIQGQGALLFKSKEVGLDDIVYIIEQLHAERQRSQLTIRARPKVTVDSSLIAYKFLETSLHPADGVSLICRALANRNIDVLIICDPPTRHHSKRAHHQRVGKKEKARLQLMLSRMELSRTQSEEKQKIEQLTKEIRKLEKAEGRCFLPPNFMERLQLLVSQYASQGKGEITIAIAPFQADPSIANAALLGECEAILSGDSDFAMYVGPGGPDNLGDIMLSNIKVHQKQSTITSCTVVTGQRKVATYVDGILTSRGLVDVFPVEPKFPLFNNIRNPKTRALLGIALGCDVLPGGVPGLGASSLSNILSTVDLETDGAPFDLATKLSTVNKAQLKDAQALLCMANSLLYERTTSELGYMFESPTILEKYNEAFASPLTRLVDGPTVLQCKGCVGQCHSFLAAEGGSHCSVCKATLCRFCIWSLPSSDVDDNGAMCFECKRYSIAGADDQKTEQEMRTFLRSHAVNVTTTATYAEVLKLFRDFNEDEHDIFGEDIKHIRYPLLPASALDHSHESSKVINKLATVKVHEIGGLLKYDVETSTSLLPAASVLRFIHFLASLTDVQRRQSKEQLSFKHAIPTNILNMATNARIHTSKRLCERSLRHATDPSTPNIQDGMITIGYFEDDVCVIIEQRVRASMKNVEYATKAAITQNHFVASVCNCRAGCSNEASPGVAAADVGQGKIICSHGMTLPVSLSLALYKGLATLVLIELRRRLQRENFEDIFGAEEIKLFRKDISCLMNATTTLATAMDTTKSILQCLDVFSVGTDSPKKPPSAPNPHDLGLLRDKCRYAKSTKTAERIVTLKYDESEMADFSFQSEESTDHNMREEYAACQMAVDALSLVFGTDELAALNDNNHNDKVPIGLELLRDRAQPTQSLLDYSYRNKATVEVAERWKTALFEWASERSSGRRKREFESAPAVVDMPVAKKQKKSFSFSNTTRRPHKYCYIVGCSGNDMTTNLIRVLNIPTKLPKEASRDRQRTYRLKQFIRRECMDRLGAGRLCKDKDVRVCEEHWEEVTGMPSISIDIHNKHGIIIGNENLPIPTFLAPRMVGRNSFESPPSSLSRGNAYDRANLRHLTAITNNEHALAHQQLVEMIDVEHGDQQLSQINPAVRECSIFSSYGAGLL